jgi:hypothetical protein
MSSGYGKPDNRSRHVRCKLCGIVFSGWLPVANAPEGSILLYHLGADHPTEVTAYLDRMRGSEDIGTVAMEAFEHVGTP